MYQDYYPIFLVSTVTDYLGMYYFEGKSSMEPEELLPKFLDEQGHFIDPDLVLIRLVYDEGVFNILLVARREDYAMEGISFALCDALRCTFDRTSVQHSTMIVKLHLDGDVEARGPLLSLNGDNRMDLLDLIGFSLGLAKAATMELPPTVVAGGAEQLEFSVKQSIRQVTAALVLVLWEEEFPFIQHIIIAPDGGQETKITFKYLNPGSGRVDAL